MHAETNQSKEFFYRVLLAVPQSKHIPYFAMGIEARRPAYDIQIAAAPSVNFNGNLLRALPSRFESFAFLSIRHRRHERTATYSSWIGFASRAMAEDFMGLVKRGRHGLNALTDRTDRDLEDIKARFESNLADGLFDLSRLKQSRRRKQADLFVRLDDEMAKLGEQATCLRQFQRDSFGEHPGMSIG